MVISMTNREHIRETLKIALPICVSNFGHMAVSIADTAFVGRIGSTEQAAILLANTPYILALVFGIGIAYGITPLVGEAHVKGDHRFNASVLRNGILQNLLLGILLFAVLSLGSPLLRLLNQPDEVVDKAIPFLNVLMLSLIPLSVFSACKQFAEGRSDTKMAMVITVVSNLLNILLNYIFIFGKFGMPAMGMMGSAWATFTSRVVMAIWMFAHVRYNRSYSIYREGGSLSMSLSLRIFKLGLGTGAQWLFEVGAFSFAALMVGWLGVKQMAAHQIALSWAAISYMIASGLSAAASVRVANGVGMNDRIQIRRSAFIAWYMGIALMGFCAIFFLIAGNMLSGILTKDAGVSEMAASLLVIAALFQLSDGTQVIGLGALRAIKDVTVPTIITLVSYWLIGIPFSWWMGIKLGWGIHGIWYGLSLGLTCAALLLFLRFHQKTRKTD